MKHEMSLAVARGGLIEKRLVERQLSYLMVAIRQKILGLPLGWTRKLTGISDSRKMKAQLEAMACQLLEDLRELPSKVIDPNWVDTLEGDGPPSQPVEAGKASGSKGRSV
jgi:hypothetical protein